MKFCTKCDNMYYLSILEDTNKLIYYCRNCGNENDTSDITGTMSVSNIQVVDNATNVSQIVNKYTKLDPTLPRINWIPCPNQECQTHKSPELEKEVIYIRFDETNIKYLYLCTHCDFTWKTNENA